jgi:plastocyanin
MYGSGSSNWGGYDDCVSQCIASFGAPPASYTPTATGGVMGASGSGATHTVIVAPTQGVLRYVPFAVNASVGDTIKFMWGANNHTVTKSSALTPCNKTSDALFNTGRQDKGFTFTQVVNDTNPTFFYCGTPGHCQKGMFGIINPPSALGAPTSVSGMMQSLGANNSDVSAYASYTTKTTANNIRAAGWGGNIDMSSLPDWSRSFVAENVLYTRNFLASNSEVLQENGFIDLSTSGSTPLMIPQDISAVLANNVPATASSPATPSTPATTSAPTPNTGAENLSNGARSLMSSRGVFTLSFAVVTFFAL